MAPHELNLAAGEIREESWGERRGLNPRPSVPQTDALPAELRSPPGKNHITAICARATLCGGRELGRGACGARNIAAGERAPAPPTLRWARGEDTGPTARARGAVRRAFRRLKPD